MMHFILIVAMISILLSGNSFVSWLNNNPYDQLKDYNLYYIADLQ